MGRIKDIATAIEEAQELGLIPQLPQTLYLLMEGLQPVGVYLHKDVADYDAWLCNSAGDAEYTVVATPFYRETLEEIECRV
jgi:hypothetical protein